jgi:trehalose-6-phosphate synthase
MLLCRRRGSRHAGERKERLSAMMATLRRNDAPAWRRRFIEGLAAVEVRR